MNIQEKFIQSKGLPFEFNGNIIKMFDTIELNESLVSVEVEFISSESNLEQGIIIQSEGFFEIKDQKINKKIVFWESTAPRLIRLNVNSKNKKLIVYNAWKSKDGTINYWTTNGAFFSRENGDEKTFFCNDGSSEITFKSLIFRLKIVSELK